MDNLRSFLGGEKQVIKRGLRIRIPWGFPTSCTKI